METLAVTINPLAPSSPRSPHPPINPSSPQWSDPGPILPPPQAPHQSTASSLGGSSSSSSLVCAPLSLHLFQDEKHATDAPFIPSGFPQEVQEGSTSPPDDLWTAAAQQTLDLRRNLCDQNVFVFHLPSEWTEDDLKKHFGEAGSILSAKVVTRPDGSSKGYGFVCYKTAKYAEIAVNRFNGLTVGGKRLKVSMKKTPEQCTNLQVRKLIELSEKSTPPFDRDDCTLFVFHLPPDWDDYHLCGQFKSFGTIVSANVAKKENGNSRGFGFVTFDTPRNAALAITNLDGAEVGANKRLKVQLRQKSCQPHPSPGCTIFVFHLPNDWSDKELYQHFQHCGKIVKATVQKDPAGASRGYGFVSFDNQRSALSAHAGMNGFAVGKKRLKVSLKKGEERYLFLGLLSPFQSSMFLSPNSCGSFVPPCSSNRRTPPPPVPNFPTGAPQFTSPYCLFPSLPLSSAAAAAYSLPPPYSAWAAAQAASSLYGNRTPSGGLTQTASTTPQLFDSAAANFASPAMASWFNAAMGLGWPACSL